MFLPTRWSASPRWMDPWSSVELSAGLLLPDFGGRRGQRLQFQPHRALALDTNRPGWRHLRGVFPFVFYIKGLYKPVIEALLQLLAGDIESNPGPTYICPSCTTRITSSRAGGGSVRCNYCRDWFHLRCTSLTTLSQYSTGWSCTTCTGPAPTRLVTGTHTNTMLSPSLPQPPPPPSSLSARTPNAQTNPVPRPHRAINILQLNIDGINTKHQELRHFILKHNIHVAIIQETKLQPRHKTPNIPSYSVLRQDRAHSAGGGLITYIHTSISYNETTAQTRLNTNADHHLELQSLKIKTGPKHHIHLINIYIPPHNSPGLPTNYQFTLQPLDTDNNIILGGDFNAKHPAWFTMQQADGRGTELATQLNSLFVLNDTDQHTHIPHQADRRATSPDITFCSPSLSTTTTWRTETDTSSDHLPIIITIQSKHTSTHRQTFSNYKKAHWSNFTQETETQFEQLNLSPITNINHTVARFNSIIQEADKKHIPKGNRKNHNPNFTSEIYALIRERNNLRKTPTPHSHNTSLRIQALNSQITNKIREQQQENWNSFLETIDHRSNTKKLYKTMRDIATSNSNQPPSHASITNNTDYIPTRQEQSNLLIKHYATISQLPKHKDDRHILRRKHQFPLDPATILATTDNTSRIIKSVKNSHATGPDNISNIHLKNLGIHGITTLTNIANFSYQYSQIPHIWKVAKIITNLKPNKPPTAAASYRPISLLCTPSKIVERLILNITTPHIPLSPTQHGFRAHHSTTTLLTNLTQSAKDGINSRRPPKRTLLLTLDISKAFDAVPRTLLTNKIFNTTLHNNSKRWLANYLTGRQAFVHYNGKSSRTRNMNNGVPQGSVLSPTLFNLYLHDIPTPPPNIQIASYADDVTITSIHHKAQDCTVQAQSYLDQLSHWLSTNRLKVAPSKSTCTLLTNYTREHQYRPHITLDNTPLPHTHEPKILGITYNTSMTFGPHINNIVNKANSRLNVLRALGGTSFGKDKNTLTLVYKQYIRAVMDYASPAWAPSLANTQLLKLQKTQNSAMRIITGCTQSTPISHLHAETLILPVSAHLDMRGTQFYATAIDNTSHPCYYMRNHPTTPRQIVQTPQKHYSDILNTIPPPHGNTSTHKNIHTHITRNTLATASDNTILGHPPPLINSTETQLSRAERVHLARLRCGHHPSLHAYRHRIGLVDTDICTNCQTAPHTITHILLECPAWQSHRQHHNITSPLQMWEDPQRVIAFLREVGRMPKKCS